MRFDFKPNRILDFDIENRPLTYMGNDWTSAEITAIAASFGIDEPVYCWLLPIDDPMAMLEGFRMLYDEADIVTGHYIRKHDLPIINGARLEYQLAPLSAKLSSDTMLDLIKKKDLSASQESLGAMFGLAEPKVHMNQANWRAANRFLHPELAKTRVIADVRQHQALRLKLIEIGALGSPRMWYSHRS
jgi:hypothetical protein